MLAVAPTGDTPGPVNEYLRENRLTFTAAVGGLQGTRWALFGVTDFGIVDRYGVSAYPTTFVLDRTGKILARMVGFDEKALRAALKQAGLE
jgi:hypothetical protein